MIQLYKALVICQPSFYIANKGFSQEEQNIHSIMIFENKDDAKEWVEDQKKRCRVLSSRVSKLNKKHIIKSSSHQGTLNVSLKVKGGAFAGFKEIVQSFVVHRQVFDSNQHGAKWSYQFFTEEQIKEFL